MAIDFKKLRASGKLNQKSKLEKLLKESGNTKVKDPRLWKPQLDPKTKSTDDKNNETHTTNTIIRFLPTGAKDYERLQNGEISEDLILPYIQIDSYSIKGKKGNLWGNALTTINKDCPIKEYQMKLWSERPEKGSKQHDFAKSLFPSSKYYANVLVINDPANPDNNGKVMIYEFTYSIFKKIYSAMNPEFDDTDPLDPFDMDNGANLKLKIKYTRTKYTDPSGKDHDVNKPSFDNVEFDQCTSIPEDEQEDLFNKCHPITEFLNEDKFKTYSEVKENLMRVMELDENLEPVDHEMKKVNKVASNENKQAESSSPSTPAQKEPTIEDVPFDVESNGEDEDDIDKWMNSIDDELDDI